jgi:hypothetical protein
MNKQGKCGRCGEHAGLLYIDAYQTREQAREHFKETYGHYPVPIGEPWK